MYPYIHSCFDVQVNEATFEKVYMLDGALKGRLCMFVVLFVTHKYASIYIYVLMTMCRYVGLFLRKHT